MKKLAISLFFLLVTQLWGYPALAQNLRTYKSSISVAIQENDIAHAKGNAFQKLRGKLLELAIQDLMGIPLYEEHYRKQYRAKALKPKDFLASYKTSNEFVANGEYTLELEARVQIGVLANTLRKLNLLMKDDPWYPVTVLVDDQIALIETDLRSRLQLFHINVPIVRSVDLSGFYWQEANSKYFIETLFNEFPQQKIIYLFDTKSLGDPPISKELRLKIFRKAGLEEINTLSTPITLAAEGNPSVSTEQLELSFKKLMSRLTIQSLGISQYDAGLETVFYLKVKGIQNPQNRESFERRILKGNRSIISYKLNLISNQFSEYHLESNSSLNLLHKTFRTDNPYFYIYVENSTADTLEIEAVSKIKKDISDLAVWVPNERTIEDIKKALVKEKILKKPEEDSEQEIELSAEFLPSLKEKEPNNNSMKLNALPPSTLMLGRISNRADEDIFQLKCGHIVKESQANFLFTFDNVSEEIPVDTTSLENEIKEANQTDEPDKKTTLPEIPLTSYIDETCDDISSVFVDWIRISKTTLSPLIRLYDQDYNFLVAYTMADSRNRLRFRHTFRKKQPQAVFLRISDKIGFIPGETGGSKYFDYLLRFNWRK
jgi:hypothetical protein